MGLANSVTVRANLTKCCGEVGLGGVGGLGNLTKMLGELIESLSTDVFEPQTATGR